MERYKKTIRVRISLLAFLVLAAAALCVYDVFLASDRVRGGMLFAFQCGFSCALGILALLHIMRLRAALRDGQKLQLLFNRENDERLKAIRAKAGLPMLLFTSVAMVIAGLVAGYFNAAVFYTLNAVALFQLVTAVIVKAVYTKRM